MSAAGVGILGDRAQGNDVRLANTTAVMAIANIVKSSLGPQGLDKMLIDEIGDVTITNDGATILRQLEVEHPSARVLVELSQLQDKEVGDGTTSVVIIAAELLKRANDLIKNKVHPSSIIKGFKLSMKEAVKYITENLTISVESLGEDALVSVAKTSMSSKIIGAESDLFAQLAVKAIRHVASEKNKVSVSSIQVMQAHGKSALESAFFDGYVLRTSRVSQQMPLRITGAKIAMVDFNLNKFRLAMGTQISVEDPKNLERIRQRECDILKERVASIIAAGANVVITTKGLDDIAAKYMVEAGIIGIRRVEKSDLRRIARATGGSVVTTLASEDGTEGFDPKDLGEAISVYEEAVGDFDHIFIQTARQSKGNVCSIILRGASEIMTEEIERSLHDSLCVLKRTLESGQMVAGGGACEAALSIFLTRYAEGMASKEQIPVMEFAEALLVIPRVLSTNAAQDTHDLLSKLTSIHKSVQANPEDEKYKGKEIEFTGLDLTNGKIRNCKKDGVLEPLDGKIKAIKFATEAAITILRIDDMIKLMPEQEAQPQRH